MRNILSWSTCVLVLLHAGSAAAESCAFGDAREPVQTYTRAMKEYRFTDAHAALTDNMTDGMGAEEWAAGQRRLFELGQVVIGELDVRWPQHIDANSCDRRALVPNVLSAKDRFNNQGSVEFEVYTTVRTPQGWRIDSQETLIDEGDIRRYFPADEIPEFKDQLAPEDILPGDE